MIIAKVAIVIALATGVVLLAQTSRKPLTVKDHERLDTVVGDGPWEVPRPRSALIRHMPEPEAM